MKKIIELNTYKRLDHFNHFRSYSYQSVGVTVDVDVTSLIEFCKKNSYSFYLLFIHCVALAADEVPELRQRIIDNQIVEYDECPTSHIELLNDSTYCYCTLHHHMPLNEYIEIANKTRQLATCKASIIEDDEKDSFYFITCLPWFKYSQFIQPTGEETNPMICWGKYELDFKNRYMLPVTIQANHALVDGIHLGMFYENLNKQINSIIIK